MRPLTIAIDGFSACGKSTLAKDLAKRLHYIFVDSGAMYRGVALYCLRHGLIQNETPLVDEIVHHLSKINLAFQKVNGEDVLFLNNENVAEEIRSSAVASVVSKVAAIKEVRQKLVNEQQKMGVSGGIIMDGRDIGTVVFPNAELKLYVTASEDVRTQRRVLELQSKGQEVDVEAIRANLAERDFLDQTREESPLKKADDAVVLDNSNLTREAQLDWVVERVNLLLKTS
ncbi:MAG: hypothetical protein RL264_3074 [Bacteroidota bacterium]|jgi:cytidylate kinase